MFFFFGSSDFQPTQLEGNVLWLDASDTSTITDSSGSVSAWADKSGNGDNATQGTGSAQPLTGIRTINGKNSLIFANGDEMGSPAVFSTEGYSVFLVMQLSVAVADMDSAFPVFVESGGGAQSNFIRQTNGNFEYKSTGTSGTDDRPAFNWEASYNTNDTAILQYEIGLSNIKVYGNGALLIDDNRTTPMTALSVDSSINFMKNMQGVFGELIVYNRVLSTPEATQVNSYLTNKWVGLSEFTDVEGLQAYYNTTDDANLTLDGDDITQFLDLSGRGNHTDVQGTASERPLRELDQINGLQAATFADGDLITSPVVFSTTGYTFFIVANLSVAVANLANTFPAFLESSGGNQANFIRKSNGRYEYKSVGVGGTDDRPNYTWESNFSTGEAVIIQCDVGLSNIKLFGNGALLNDDDRATPMTSLTVDSGISIMKNMEGALSALLVFDRILTTVEADFVESKLSTMFNIELA